jgi:hypothetical protein
LRQMITVCYIIHCLKNVYHIFFILKILYFKVTDACMWYANINKFRNPYRRIWQYRYSYSTGIDTFCEN